MRRSWLFVPGDRPERFAKAAASGAHAIICDLEDAVAPDGKERARDAVQRWLLQERAFVRINGIGTPWYADDLDALAGHVGLLGVMLPKAETSDQLAAVSAALPSSVPVVPIIESAAGVHAAPLIAAGEGVARIGFGSIDFALDCGLDESDEALLYARSRIVVASRAARLAPPVDGVSTHLEDMGGHRRRRAPRPGARLRRQVLRAPRPGRHRQHGVRAVRRGARLGTARRGGVARRQRHPRGRSDDRQAGARTGPAAPALKEEPPMTLIEMTQSDSDRRLALREEVRVVCAGFRDEYWRKLDRERAYPEAFVEALTEAGWLAR